MLAILEPHNEKNGKVRDDFFHVASSEPSCRVVPTSYSSCSLEEAKMVKAEELQKTSRRRVSARQRGCCGNEAVNEAAVPAYTVVITFLGRGSCSLRTPSSVVKRIAQSVHVRMRQSSSTRTGDPS